MLKHVKLRSKSNVMQDNYHQVKGHIVSQLLQCNEKSSNFKTSSSGLRYCKKSDVSIINSVTYKIHKYLTNKVSIKSEDAMVQ